MTTGWPLPSARLLAVGFLFVFGITLLPGCDDSYPQDLRYPPRFDELAVGKPTADAKRIDRPGEFPHLFVAVEDGKTDQEQRADRAEKLKSLLLIPADKFKNDENGRAQLEELDGAMELLFGTPARPHVDAPNNDAIRGILDKLNGFIKLDDISLARGSVIYRDTCLHCHGLTGDGHGPTAPWVNPHPRDYRQGVFKFTSSFQGVGDRKPLKEDLVRTIREGIEGTSMPNFRLMPDDDLEAIIGYVVHLSLRGQVEFETLKSIAGGAISSTASAKALEWLQLLSGNWLDAQSSRIVPESAPNMKDDQLRQSIRHGYELFTVTKGDGGCISCHLDFGRQSAYKFDTWGTIVRPANLTTGIYRGGRRPIDIYWRIHSGINGSGMQAFGKAKPGDAQGLPAKDLWDLVNFVQALPYPAMLKEAGIKLDAP